MTSKRPNKRPRSVFTKSRSSGFISPESRMHIGVKYATMEKPVVLFDNSSTGSIADALLTVPEVASLLKISGTSVRRYQSHMHACKVGGSIRFRRTDVLAYLKARRMGLVDQ